MMAVVGGCEVLLNLHVHAYSLSQAVTFLSLCNKSWCRLVQSKAASLKVWSLTLMFWCNARNCSTYSYSKWKLQFLSRCKRVPSGVTMFCLSFARLTFTEWRFFFFMVSTHRVALRAEPSQAEPRERIREHGEHSYMTALPLRNF